MFFSWMMLIIVGHLQINVIGSPGCPYGWHEFSQSCYEMVTDTRLDWYAARQRCLNAGSDLVVPNSKSENEFIWNLTKELIKETVPGKNIWLGCTYNGGHWTCINPNKYNNQNSKVNGSGFGCAVLMYKLGEWNFVECSPPSLRLFLCERKRCTQPVRCFTLTTDPYQATPYCLLGHTFKETIIQNPIQCCLACSKDPNCHSFNLSGKMCQLNNVTISQVDGDKKSVMENCVYYEYE